jgi:cbb3-type cytochrome oxidase subunit 3
MADDVSFIRRKSEAESWGALVGVLFLVGLVWWIFHS